MPSDPPAVRKNCTLLVTIPRRCQLTAFWAERKNAMDAGPKPKARDGQNGGENLFGHAVGGAHQQSCETDHDKGGAEERCVSESPSDHKRRRRDAGERPREHDRCDHPRRRPRPTAANALHIQRDERVQAQKPDSRADNFPEEKAQSPDSSEDRPATRGLWIFAR